MYFDIANGKEDHRTKIFTEGPNAVEGGAFSYDFINADSIVLSAIYRSCVYLVNSEGVILKKYMLSDKEPMIHNTVFTSIVNVPVVAMDNVLEIPCFIPYSRNILEPNPKSFNFADYPIAYLLDMNTFELKASKVHYPHLYDNDNLVNHDEMFSRVQGGNNLVYSFHTYDSILVTSDHVTSQMYNAKSRYIGKVRNLGVKVGASREELHKKGLNPHYRNIVYDKYRKVYYRFAYYEYDFPGPYNVDFLLSGGPFSIIIMDDKFNVVGETVFPKDTYATRIWFVNKEGLWLSENNFQRKDMTDDVLSFRCLKLKEKGK